MARKEFLVDGFCFDCEKIKPIVGRGLCNSCYHKRRYRGTHYELPRRPLTISRYEEFLFMVKYTEWMTQKEMAARIGVNLRTIHRYNAHYKGIKKIESLVAVGL